MPMFIPNFNSFSTLIDRLSIENVKLAHFEFLLDQESVTSSRAELYDKIAVQHSVITALKEELSKMMVQIYVEKKYETLEEKRTFQ